MQISYQDYGVAGTTQWERTYRHPGEGWIEMAEARPCDSALAQEDGTWLVPPEPDMPLNVADEIVAALPTAYPWIFARLGFGDVV